MSEYMPDKSEIKNGVLAGLPVLIGYFPIAVTFGLLAKSVNISLFESFCFSAMVFAGASQFVGLNMFHAGIGLGEITLTVFLLNFRHFLMSATLASRTYFNRFLIPVISFGVTDETFAVAAMKKGDLSGGYMLALNFTAYSGWVTGTVAGYAAGDFLPAGVQASISICLYAMFVAILIPAVKKSFSAGAIAVIAAAVNTLLGYMGILSSGWNIVISIVAASAAGMFLFKGEK
jgi:predicted branched-subunit amino acid permease